MARDVRAALAAVNVAAFDFDGTLVNGDSLLPFLRWLCGVRRLVAAGVGSRRELLAMRRGGDARDVAKAAFLSRALPGIDARRASELADAYAARLEGRLRPDTLARLRQHQADGDRVVLVSASPALYLEPLGRRLGLDAVLATGLVVGPDGRFTGELLGANCRGPEKARRLETYLATLTSPPSASCSSPTPITLWAYGDSDGDREMLAMADHGIFVR